MARIYQKGNNFLIWSNVTESEKLAFSSPLRGQALRDALESYRIDLYLSGWSASEVIADLEESGILNAAPAPAPAPALRANMPEVLKKDKGGKYYEFNGLAKYFSTRSQSFTGAEWSDDRFGGRASGGWGRVEYSNVTPDQALEDYKNNPQSWRPYELRYNPNFRENDVVLL